MFAERAVVEARLSVVLPVTESVPPTTSLPLTVRLVDDALPNVDVPDTSVVTVALVAVRLVKNADRDESVFVKNVVEVLLVDTSDVAVAVVKNPEDAIRDVIVEEDEVKSVMTALVIVVVAKVTVPVAVSVPVVRAEVDAVVRNAAFAAIEVKVGVVLTLIVEVPVSVILDPAVKYVVGVVRKEFHAVVEAVRGMVYPAVTVGVKVSVDPVPEIVKPSDVADEVAKVYEVAERPLMVVVAKYPLSTLPDHERLEPACIREEGVV